MLFTTKTPTATYEGEPNDMNVCTDLRFFAPGIHMWYHDRVRGVVVKAHKGKLPPRYQKQVDKYQAQVAAKALEGLDAAFGDDDGLE
jgi:hypothetical protein